jgi:protein-tyrosine phosphatase
VKFIEGAEADLAVDSSSVQKPLGVSWFFTEKDLMENLKLKTNVEVKNKLGVSQCPGKKLAMGRDGKSHDRNIYLDLEHFRQV